MTPGRRLTACALAGAFWATLAAAVSLLLGTPHLWTAFVVGLGVGAGLCWWRTR